MDARIVRRDVERHLRIRDDLYSKESKRHNLDMNEANHLKPEDPFVFERGKPRVRALDSDRTDGVEWLRASMQRRIETVEFLRADFVGANYATQRLS
jgi:hypothetical protein